MSEVKVDTISERTAASGVTIDGVLIKDSVLKIPGGSPGADKVLTSDASGNATWVTAAAGGGGLVWIAGASNNAAVSSIDFIDCFTATYSSYMVVFSRVEVVSAGQNLYISVGNSDLSSIQVGNFANEFYNGSHSNNSNHSDAAGFRVSGNGCATEGISGTMFIYQPYSSTERTGFYSTGNGRNTNWGYVIAGGECDTSTTAESIRIKSASGNIGSTGDNARIDVYGMVNS